MTHLTHMTYMTPMTTFVFAIKNICVAFDINT